MEGGAGTGQTIAEVVVESEHGDPRYLDAARKALADLRKLWGMDAPQRVDVHATAPYATLSEAELLAVLAEQDALLGPPADPAPPELTVTAATPTNAADGD